MREIVRSSPNEICPNAVLNDVFHEVVGQIVAAAQAVYGDRLVAEGVGYKVLRPVTRRISPIFSSGLDEAPSSIKLGVAVLIRDHRGWILMEIRSGALFMGNAHRCQGIDRRMDTVVVTGLVSASRSAKTASG